MRAHARRRGAPALAAAGLAFALGCFGSRSSDQADGGAPDGAAPDGGGACPDGTRCAAGELCRLDPADGSYGCVAGTGRCAVQFCAGLSLPACGLLPGCEWRAGAGGGCVAGAAPGSCDGHARDVCAATPGCRWDFADCPDLRECGAQCCPIGAGRGASVDSVTACREGRCPLPDLHVDAAFLRPYLERVRFSPGDCAIEEGCVGGPGPRLLLRFSTRTPNDGEGDLVMGVPSENPDVFDFSACHGHHHYTGYADYALVDAAGGTRTTGHKQAFCLLDFPGEGPPGARAVYQCGNQGIQHGWADVYDADLDCQWIDVTDVAPGDYRLRVALNPDRSIAEADYDDNVVEIPVTVPASSCPAGCAAPEGCCADDDPCGLAGDGSCDCGGRYRWDAADCASCLLTVDDDPECNTCPAGCFPDECRNGSYDPNWAGDGACDCGGPAGGFEQEADDCRHCACDRGD